MRRLPAVLLAAGLILGVVLPIAGLGRLPFLIGVACLVAAGLATRRAPLALAGIAAAVLLFLLPGFLIDRRNDQGIAWTAPKGERVVFAGAGLAVTSQEAGQRIAGRDLATGKRRWVLGLPEGSRGDVQVRRVGRTLLVSDRASTLRAVDLATGKLRWDTPPVKDGYQLPAIANPELVATSVCGTRPGCTAEVRSIADGKVRWRAPTTSSDWLGSPPIAQSLGADRPLWPASAVVLGNGERYEVRRLESGKVVARGRDRDDSLGVTGNLLLRETNEKVLSATDVTTGKVVWTRDLAGRTVARAPDDTFSWLGIPDGGLILTGAFPDMDTLTLAGELRVLDPRTGEVTAHPTHVRSAGGTVVVPTDEPPVTAVTATAGAKPGVPVIGDYFDDRVLADGRVYRAEFSKRAIGAIPTQVGWRQPVHAFGHGDRNGAVVRDRRNGRELVRYTGDDAYVSVSSEGERLVIHDGGRDLVVKP
jgi:outer membrane protein assembly factor BamB